MEGKPTVLLAEDDENDQFLVQRAFRRHHLQVELQIVNNGELAIAYLAGKDQFADRTKYPVPALVLLDIKMPKRSGLEVLEWIRHHSECHLVPVVIMSSSSLQEDVDRAYELGVNTYLIKPAAFEELAEMFKDATDLFVNKAAKPRVS